MAINHDILLDPVTGDLAANTARDEFGLITDGLVYGEATAQHQAVVLMACKGEFKEYPTLGVGVINMVNDDDLTGWNREIRLQLEAIDMAVKNVDYNMTTKKLTVDADYRAK